MEIFITGDDLCTESYLNGLTQPIFLSTYKNTILFITKLFKMLLNTIIWLAMLFYLSGSLAAPSNFDTSSLMARDALGDPMIEAKAAAIGWISNGALHHRVYYIDTAGRIIQWGSDSNIDGGSWSMIEIVPGTIADRGPGIAVDHYVTVDNNVWVSLLHLGRLSHGR